MSKHNNVNPGQYKVAGRDKMGKRHGGESQPKEAFSLSRKQERGAVSKRKAKR